MAAIVRARQRADQTPYTPAGSIAADDVAEALAELDAEKIPLTQKGVANGVATLGADAKIPGAQLPALAIGETFTVASQAAMLALTAQRGDIAIRTDLDPDAMFLLTSDSPSTLVDWVQITAPGAVLSVNTRTGAVVGLAEASDLATESAARVAADAALAVTSLHVGAAAMQAGSGAPSIGITPSGGHGCWLLDADVVELVSFDHVIPSGWATYNVDLYWTNMASAAGNVTLRFDKCGASDTEDIDSGRVTGANVVVAANAIAGRLKVTRLLSAAAPVADTLAFGRVVRVGNNASDTLANDIGVLKVVIAKAS